jgi:hypothetical protein
VYRCDGLSNMLVNLSLHHKFRRRERASVLIGPCFVDVWDGIVMIFSDDGACSRVVLVLKTSPPTAEALPLPARSRQTRDATCTGAIACRIYAGAPIFE